MFSRDKYLMFPFIGFQLPPTNTFTSLNSKGGLLSTWSNITIPLTRVWTVTYKYSQIYDHQTFCKIVNNEVIPVPFEY